MLNCYNKIFNPLLHEFLPEEDKRILDLAIEMESTKSLHMAYQI
jgi:hypothetical protein